MKPIINKSLCVVATLGVFSAQSQAGFTMITEQGEQYLNPPINEPITPAKISVNVPQSGYVFEIKKNEVAVELPTQEIQNSEPAFSAQEGSSSTEQIDNTLPVLNQTKHEKEPSVVGADNGESELPNSSFGGFINTPVLNEILKKHHQQRFNPPQQTQSSVDHTLDSSQQEGDKIVINALLKDKSARIIQLENQVAQLQAQLEAQRNAHVKKPTPRKVKVVHSHKTKKQLKKKIKK